MLLSSKQGERGEAMGIENSTLNKRVYKGDQLYHCTNREEGEQSRVHGKKNPKSIAPISETRFIHSHNTIIDAIKENSNLVLVKYPLM